MDKPELPISILILDLYEYGLVEVVLGLLKFLLVGEDLNQEHGKCDGYSSSN